MDFKGLCPLKKFTNLKYAKKIYVWKLNIIEYFFFHKVFVKFLYNYNLFHLIKTFSQLNKFKTVSTKGE